MDEYDLHGYTVIEAFKRVGSILCELILNCGQECGILRIITGNGGIKEKLLSDLGNDWDVDIREELGNNGVLIIEWNHE